jgi:hypothetical protein
MWAKPNISTMIRKVASDNTGHLGVLMGWGRGAGQESPGQLLMVFTEGSDSLGN